MPIKLILGALLAVTACAGATLALAGAFDGSDGSRGRPAASPTADAAGPSGPTSAPSPPPVPLEQLVGQKLFVRMSGTAPSPDLTDRIRRGEVGGVVLFSDNITSPSQLSSLSQALQQAAAAGGNPPLLIGVDQEGGKIKRVSGPPTLTPTQMGHGGASAASDQGRATGKLLSSRGINVDFAPVADVPSSPRSFIAVEGRGFADKPQQVATTAGAFAAGLQGERVAATAKHFPGVGTLATDTDSGQQTASDPRSVLDANLLPFRSLIGAGVDLVMASTALYPAYDQSQAPAALSRPILQDLLRKRLGFRGVIVTDDLEMPTGGAPPDAAIRAANAGADLLLLGSSEVAGGTGYAKLLQAAQQGALDRAALAASYERIQALKQKLR